MDVPTAATIIAGLKILGQPTLEVLKTTVEKILTPSADALGRGIATPLEAWATKRADQATGALVGAAVLLEKIHVEPSPVPGRLLWPILEKASIEEDRGLQEKWIALLAQSAVPGNSVPPAFPAILSELSPLDATVLDWLFEQSPFRTNPPSGSFQTVTGERAMGELHLRSNDLAIVVTNLKRNSLITAPDAYSDPRELAEHRFQHLGISTYGVAFVRACRPPTT